MTKECPECHVALIEVAGSNLDGCPKCGRWFFVDEEREILTEVI